MEFRGMLNMLLVFVPWIVRGFLFDLGEIQSAALALVCCLGIVYLQTRRHKLTTLDVTNLCYFSALTFVAALGMQTLLQYSSTIGFCFLSLACFFTILRGRPLTIPYAKVGTDEKAMHSDSFVVMNNIITGAWGMGFMFDALIAFQLDAGAQSAPWLLVPIPLLLVVFSVIFPRIAGKHMVSAFD